MKMRKGWALVEMLTVLAVAAIALIPLAKLVTITLRDIPRSYRTIQSNTSILNALKQICDDVNFAKNLSADDNLLIEHEDCTIMYRIFEETITRSRQNKASEDKLEVRTWPISKGKINFKVWQQSSKAYALEIETYIEQKSGDRIEKKMKNSHLYFVGAYK